MLRIYDGRNEFFQWDLNQKLIITDTSVKEVHFYNKNSAEALVSETRVLAEGLLVVDVPNILLQECWPIKACAHCGECYTKTTKTFNVLARSKPSDYLYEETEVLNYNSLVERITDLEKTISAIEFDGQVTIEDVAE